jgi:hypothetical protein
MREAYPAGGRMSAAGLREVERSSLAPIADVLPDREDLEAMNRQVKRFVSERPVLAVFLALSAGYVLGRIISGAT